MQHMDTTYLPSNLTTTPTKEIGNLDSGATAHFMPESYKGEKEQKTPVGITVETATPGTTIQSTATDIINWPTIKPAAKQCHKFPDDKLTEPLVSVPQLALHGYSTLMTPTKAIVFDEQLKPVITGNFDRNKRAFQVPLPTKKPKEQANLAYEITSVPSLIKFHHASAGYPTTTTWKAAIRKGFYLGWPGLTETRVTKYHDKSIPTVKGHQQLVRQNTRSTTTHYKPRTRAHQLAVTIEPKSEFTNRIAFDLCGRYPITSGNNNKYILILHDIDANYTHGVALTSRKAEEILRGFKKAYQVLLDNNFQAKDLRCDNETSHIFLDYLNNDAHLTHQKVPPNNHRSNPAETAVRDFKQHFIAMRAGLPNEYPAHRWDLLIPLCNLTHNLLRPSQIQPNLSAHQLIHGNFDYNKFPLAPAGCKVIAYETPNVRPTWADHGVEGFYIGPSKEHYRSHLCYIPKTGQTRISDTVAFFPNFDLPQATTIDELQQATEKITQLLSNPTPHHTQTAEEALTDLKQLFNIDTALGQRVNLEKQQQTKAMPKRENKTQPPQRVTKEIKQTPPQRVTKEVKQTQGRTTRRNKLHDKGTIVRKWFKEDHKHHEGEVTEYDHVNELYTIRYLDGTKDEYSKDEMKTHYKPEQKYSHQKYKGRVLTTRGLLDNKPNPNRSNTLAKWSRESNFDRQLRGKALAANGTIWDPELQKQAHYRDLIKHQNSTIKQRWLTGGENEFGRLCQGFPPNKIEGMDVIEWIFFNQVPKDKQVTYARYTVAFRPEKEEQNRVRITAGGDKLTYDGPTSTQVSTLETFKLLVNSTISRKNAKMFTGDVSNMYLESWLKTAEYVRFKLDQIPPRIVEYYQLSQKTHNGYVYAKINKAWYGLKQSGKIAHDDLVEHLAKIGYHKGKTEGLFLHKEKDLVFCLVVDDFACRYSNKQDALDLITHIEKKYKFKVDWDANQYIGINLKWDYNKRRAQMSMNGYVEQALEELQHPKPKRPEWAPSHMERPNYGATIQYAETDDTEELDENRIKYKQRAIGKLLYYGRAIDNTMLHAINDIATAKNTEKTMNAVKHLLNYAATNPEATVEYRASDMIIAAESDAAYLVSPGAKSRAGGIYYLTDTKQEQFNGAVMVLAKTIKHVMSSAAEAEMLALFMNAQELIPLRLCLEELGHKQPPTTIKTDNSTAMGIANETIKQKRSKSMDMRIHWVRDRIKQNQFRVTWEAGTSNLADYPTKHHTGTHHKKVRPIYLHEQERSPTTLKGCIKILEESRDKARVGKVRDTRIKNKRVTWASNVERAVESVLNSKGQDMMSPAKRSTLLSLIYL